MLSWSPIIMENLIKSANLLAFLTIFLKALRSANWFDDIVSWVFDSRKFWSCFLTSDCSLAIKTCFPPKFWGIVLKFAFDSEQVVMNNQYWTSFRPMFAAKTKESEGNSCGKKSLIRHGGVSVRRDLSSLTVRAWPWVTRWLWAWGSRGSAPKALPSASNTSRNEDTKYPYLCPR